MLGDLGFLISALIVLSVVAYRFFHQKQIPTIRNHVFGMIIIIGELDLVFDIFSSTCVNNPGVLPNFIGNLFTYLFFITQFLITYYMFYFIFVLTGHPRRYKKIIAICLLPLITGFLLLILNFPYHEIFYITVDGTYIRGPLNFMTFVVAGFYVVSSLIASCALEKRIGKECKNTMVTATLSSILIITIQLFIRDVSLTGVAIAFSITIMYLYLNNNDSLLDGITGCFDRSALVQYLNGGRICPEMRFGILVSMKGFRHVNTIYGSAAGDAILKQTGEFLIDLHKEEGNCLVFRMIGDVFLILYDSKEKYEAMYHVLSNTHLPYTYQKKRIDLDARLIRIEDFDLYSKRRDFISILEFASMTAKNSLTGNEVIVDQRFLNEYEYMQSVEKYVQTAIHENLFYIVYQPIYSFKEKRFTMLEALVRLKHPVYGNISPDVFIPLAEKNGMIEEVSDCVLDLVTDFVTRTDLEVLGIQNVKINLSAVDFMDEHLKERIENVLNKPNMKQGFIGFEITETMATTLSQELEEMFGWFREQDLSISMDDFGSGFANVENIMRLRFNMIKLDRSLLVQIHNSIESRKVYSGLVKILKELDIPSVAEGVETEEDVEILRDWGVSYIQGFYFSKPLEEEELLEVLTNQR